MTRMDGRRPTAEGVLYLVPAVLSAEIPTLGPRVWPHNQITDVQPGHGGHNEHAHFSAVNSNAQTTVCLSFTESTNASYHN